MEQERKLQRNITFDTLERTPSMMNDYLELDNQAIQRGSVFGKCLVCGHDVLFAVHHPNLREALVCPVCQSYNRQRQLIAALSLELYGEVVDLKTVLSRLRKGTRILLLESVTNLAEAMKYYAGNRVEIVDTEYLDPRLASGEVGSTGIMHLDMEKTHFPDNHFDLVIHADVFEHVANAPAAEAEQIRVLKKGGRAVYTAPFESHLDADDVYAELEGDTIKHHRDPVYHGDPSPRDDRTDLDGCLVFRVFSYQGMYERYKGFGAKFSCRYVYGRDYGMLGNNGYVFIATKGVRG
jgi:SAM-dependent methyltransferase